MRGIVDSALSSLIAKFRDDILFITPKGEADKLFLLKVLYVN